MAQCEDVREPNGETTVVSDEATTGAVDTTPATPAVATEATTEAKPAPVEAVAAPKAEEAAPQSGAPQSINPAASPAVAAPTRVAPAVLPPPLRRDHDGRASAARTPVRPKPDANKAAPPPAKDKPKSRFALLAATLALAAGLGGTVGAMGIPALVQVALGTATAAAPAAETGGDLQDIKAALAQVTTDLGALRTSVEQSSKATAAQFGKVTERLDRADRALAEPTAKLAKIGESIERLERRGAPPAPAAAAQADITGTAHAPSAAEPKPKPPIIEDYVVRKVFDGVALVEGRRGIVEVEPGSTLPGAGRVEEIRRQDGRWVVITSKGVIGPARY